MRKGFPGYQPRTPSKIWDGCIFSFDASALLDLYRMTSKSRNEFLSIMDRLKDRGWLSHQAALEYWDNRIEVIQTGLEPRAQMVQWAKDAVGRFRKEFDRYQGYQWLDAEHWSKIMAKASEQIEHELSKEKWDLDDFENSDPIAKRLMQIFTDDRVGEPCTDMADVYERAEQRVRLSVPPGFRDGKTKDNYHRYGDVILWFQLLDHAASTKKPIVFITSDSKDDWWQRKNNKTVGPRPELIQEMHVKANVGFYMYNPASFVEHAQKYLDLQAESAKIKAAAAELRNIQATKSIASLVPFSELLARENVLLQDRYKTYLEQLSNSSLLLQDRYNPLKTYMEQLNSPLLRARNPFESALNPIASIRGQFEETILGPIAKASRQFEELVLRPLVTVGVTAGQFSAGINSILEKMDTSSVAKQLEKLDVAKGIAAAVSPQLDAALKGAHSPAEPEHDGADQSGPKEETPPEHDPGANTNTKEPETDAAAPPGNDTEGEK